MNYYPSLTRVKSAITIQRERLLPTAGEVEVRIGQDVTPVQVIARATEDRGFFVLNAAQILAASPHEIEKYLLIEANTAVNKGTPILSKPRRFGRSKKIASPGEGVYAGRQGGYLLFRRPPGTNGIRAMLTGQIASVLGNRGALIKTTGALVQGVWGSGREGYGQIQVYTPTADGVPDVEDLSAQTRGALIVAGHLDTLEFIEEAENNGARGFIVGSLSAQIYENISSASSPILVTDGIGRLPMAAPIFELLQEHQEREGSIFAYRPGGHHRPELIIPMPETVPDDSGPKPEENNLLRVGQTVRILRAPYSSQVGTVVGVFNHARRIGIGSRIIGSDVALPDGQVVFVSNNNLDIVM